MTCNLLALVVLIPLLLLLLTFSAKSSAKTMLDVVDFGARADGNTDLASSLARAWELACRSTTPSTIYVPTGNFYLSRASFSGPCKSIIAFHIDGTIVASSSYGGLSKSDHGQWILFDNVRHVSIDGGTLDGQGSALWNCKASKASCPHGVTNLAFNNAKDIKITGLTSINSKLYHIVIDKCKGVTLQGVRVIAPENSPNTDGVHVQRSNSVTITTTTIGTGDDCVSVGPGTTDLWIERVSCGPGHGISIGSLGKSMMEEGVQNVTVKTVSFKDTQNGLRIKSWGRPSNGFVKGVAFQHATMQNVHNPIIIDQNYCPHGRRCPDQNSGISISQVAYYDIHGTSATPVAVNFDCSSSKPCSGIRLQNIRLTYQSEKAISQCKNARGGASGYVVPPSCL